MAAQFELEILTPERQFFVGLAEAIVLPSIDGSYGVQAGHEPVVIAVEPGELQYQIDGVWHRAAVGQGFAEIMPEYVILLAATAEHPEEIDEARARCARSRACRSITVPKPHWHAPWHDSKPASSKDLFSQTEHRICAPFFAVQTDFALDTRKNAVELSAACVIR